MKRIKNIHPGEILLEEFLLPLNITAYRLAKSTGMPQTRISAIIKGNRAISAATALRLAAYFRRVQIAFILLLCACNSRRHDVLPTDQLAIRLNNEALRIYMHNVSNKDSLQKALILLDSAIFLRKDKNFYTNKYIVARRLGQYTLALASCDSILAVDHNDFFATLHKGYIFEDMNHTDSQNSYYSKAYSLLDSSRAWQSANMVRDREKIILKGLLKDTVAYRQMVDVFIVKYDTSKVYKGIANEFSTFDRDRFLERF